MGTAHSIYWVQAACFNRKTSILIQKHHPYTGDLNREASGDCKCVFLHCGDVLGTCVEKVDSVDSHSKIWQQAVQLLDEGFQLLNSLANTSLVRSPPTIAPCLQSVNFGVGQHFCIWVSMQKGICYVRNELRWLHTCIQASDFGSVTFAVDVKWSCGMFSLTPS